MTQTPAQTATQTAALEIAAAVAAIDVHQTESLLLALSRARRIVAFGLGREGLMLRALVMRLYHLGLDAHVWGDMTCPPVGPGDLFLVSAGPGGFATTDGLATRARDAGAQVALITAEPGGSMAPLANLTLVIPAQTMASDRGPAATSSLPMGSLFEGAMFLAFELMVVDLRNRLAVAPDAMRARHTNLE